MTNDEVLREIAYLDFGQNPRRAFLPNELMDLVRDVIQIEVAKQGHFAKGRGRRPARLFGETHGNHAAGIYEAARNPDCYLYSPAQSTDSRSRRRGSEATTAASSQSHTSNSDGAVLQSRFDILTGVCYIACTICGGRHSDSPISVIARSGGRIRLAHNRMDRSAVVEARKIPWHQDHHGIETPAVGSELLLRDSSTYSNHYQFATE